MVTLTPQEATIISYIEKFAKAGSPREDLQPFINRLKGKAVKELAEKRIAAINAPTTVRPPKVRKTRQRKVRTQPLRVQKILNNPARTIATIQYYKLAKEYRQKTGKHFKRNGWEMRQRMSKLDAIKRRLDAINNEPVIHEAMKDLAKKNSMEFHLGGAL